MEKKNNKHGLSKIIAVCAILIVLIASTFNTIKSNLNLSFFESNIFSKENIIATSPINNGKNA